MSVDKYEYDGAGNREIIKALGELFKLQKRGTVYVDSLAKNIMLD